MNPNSLFLLTSAVLLPVEFSAVSACLLLPASITVNRIKLPFALMELNWKNAVKEGAMRIAQSVSRVQEVSQGAMALLR